MKKYISILLVFAMVLALTACGGGATQKETGSTEPSKEIQENAQVSAGETYDASTESEYLAAYTDSDGVVRASAACTQNITSLDVLNGTAGGQTRCMWDMIYETLLTTDENGDPVGELAVDWDVTDDYKEWTFYLRENVYFHNGELFNADDVACTMQRIMDGKGLYTQVTGFWSYISGYEIVDDYTIKVFCSDTYATPYESLTTSGYIIEDKAFAELGDKYFYDGYCYGTGKWKFKEFVDGSHITVTRNDNHWSGVSSNVDEFTLYFITEGSAIVTGMLSGEVDACNRLGADLMSMFDGHDEIALGKVSTNSIAFIGLQCGEGSPFHDVKVRQALSYSIDRQLIADAIMGGGDGIASWIPVGSYGYTEDFAPIYDPELAQQLLEESSYNGEEIIIYVNTAVTNGEAMLLTVCDMANSIGFNIKIQMVEQAFVSDVRSTGDYDAYVVTVSYSSKDSGSTYKSRFGNPGHHHNYDNDELYDLIEQIQTAAGEENRTSILNRINTIMYEECAPALPLVTMQYNNAVREGLAGYYFDQYGMYYYTDIYIK